MYHDHLISITEDQIIFAHYYFPTGKQKMVQLADIGFTVEDAEQVEKIFKEMNLIKPE